MFVAIMFQRVLVFLSICGSYIEIQGFGITQISSCQRFLTKHANIDASGQHFEFVPFGSGRRSCPGDTLALQVSHLTLARFLQGFEFMTPSNMPIDMTEGLGLSLPKATPLEVLLTPRLALELYQ